MVRINARCQSVMKGSLKKRCGIPIASVSHESMINSEKPIPSTHKMEFSFIRFTNWTLPLGKILVEEKRLFGRKYFGD